MRGWSWAVLLFCICLHILLANAAATNRFNLRDDTSPASAGIQDLRMISSQIPSTGIAGGNPFDISSNQTSPDQVTSKVYNNAITPGRRLGQVDKIFQQNYWVVGCKAGTPGGAAARLKNLITEIRLNLRLVIRETRKGTDSELGFEAFFKTNENIPRVLKIFSKIANGDKVRAPKSHGRSNWLKPKKTPPVIGCSSSVQGEFTSESYKQCQDPPRYAYYPSDSVWVYLCPVFWDVPATPSGKYCPQVYDNGTVTSDSTLLHMSQQAIFVHELVHMYLGSLAGNLTERYAVGDAMKLSAKEAIKNASNYGYFYAGNSLRLRSFPCYVS